jgi:hypothetical protein
MEDLYVYNGYSLDDNIKYDLSDKDRDLLDACIYLVDNRSSIRVTAKNYGYRKSSLHRYIHLRLPKLSHELFGLVKIQMNVNYEHRSKGRVC